MAYKLGALKKPSLYNVIISTSNNTIKDRIGFKSIEVQGKQVLLNGKPVF